MSTAHAPEFLQRRSGADTGGDRTVGYRGQKPHAGYLGTIGAAGGSVEATSQMG